jgi:hypothetical protein
MAKLSTIKDSIEQRVCVYGPPKVGKTRLVAMLARKYKLIVFDLENGSVVMTQVPEEFHDNIDIIKIRDSRVYPIAIETMMKVIKGSEVFICQDHSKVSCPICKKNPAAVIERICLNEIGLDTIVVVDSLTQLTNSGIAHITKAQPDDYKLQQDDWGALKVLMDKFLSQVQVAPYNIVCISHEEEVKFEDGRTKIVPVAGSGNSSRITAKYFDHVIYCNVVNKKHVVGSSTDYSISVLTGSRTNVKLEANKEGGDLLEIFTNWKLPNFGMPITSTEVGSVAAAELDSMTPTRDAANQIAAEKVLTATEEDISKMSPGQRALYNLKAKAAAAKTGS